MEEKSLNLQTITNILWEHLNKQRLPIISNHLANQFLVVLLVCFMLTAFILEDSLDGMDSEL